MTLVHRIRAALAAHPRRVDAVVAGVLAAIALFQVLAFPITSRPLGVVIALASTLPIAWRRPHPVAAALVGTVPWIVPTDRQYVIVGYIAVFFLLYGAGAFIDDGRVVLAVVGWAVAMTVLSSALNDEIFPAYVGGLTAVIAPAAVGRFVRRQRAQARRLALAEERARIARELHDVVAHSVSVIVVQADGADGGAGPRPRAGAGRRCARSRRPAAQALAEMRRMLGVLRADDDGAGCAPQPGLGELDALVGQRARRRGAGRRSTVEGDAAAARRRASTSSAYRIVQEALTNVLKHAGAGARRACACAYARRAWSSRSTTTAAAPRRRAATAAGTA